jgi:prepilin-type N-terminal cleavage/methylation domain-containing protein
MSRRGFTLLEVLVAMSILIIIVAVVYASFASVTDTISVARVRTEEMRLRQFLERSIRTNLTSVYVDRAYEQQVFQFVGINDQNTTGPCN